MRPSCSIPDHFALIDVQDLIRLSVGLEHIDDIIEDFEQAFRSAKRRLSGSAKL